MSTSKYTRCPECQTTFRVTEQQLALRDGQVRCGRCRTVFNAYSTLVDPKGLRLPGPGMGPAEVETMTLRDFVPVKEEAEQTEAIEKVEPPTAAAHLLADLESQKQSDGEETPIKEKAIEAKPAEEKSAEEKPAKKKADPSDNVTLVLVEDTVSRLSQMAAASTHTAPSIITGASSPSTTSSRSRSRSRSGKKTRRSKSDPTPMALVLDSDTPGLWKKLGLPSWARPVFYGVALSLLAIGLWAQIVLYFHDSLAYQYPGLKPFLTASCDILNCRIEPYHDLDALTIESSELHSVPEHPNRLALTATIRNRGKQAVAYPMLQLELTDLQDQVSGRRYFAPDLYLGDDSVIARGLDGNRDATFTLLLESHLNTASGYRLSLVYPSS
jgi:Protein of unknown function (DUF3426).